MNKMYELGSKYGTDKVTLHKYHEIFPTYIDKFYDQSGGMIEIGLAPRRGIVSLDLWLDLFPNMHIYGLDKGTPNEFSERYTILECDQSKENQISNCIDQVKHKIYFINDDGSHIPEHQLLTFNKLFPLLEVGGIYIIEDIELSYWTKGDCYGYPTRYGKGNSSSIIEIFKQAIDGVNVEFSKSDEGKVQHQREIGSIAFAKNCIIITKRELDNEEYRFLSNL